jgi:hypothetical protein
MGGEMNGDIQDAAAEAGVPSARLKGEKAPAEGGMRNAPQHGGLMVPIGEKFR